MFNKLKCFSNLTSQCAAKLFPSNPDNSSVQQHSVWALDTLVLYLSKFCKVVHEKAKQCSGMNMNSLCTHRHKTPWRIIYTNETMAVSEITPYLSIKCIYFSNPKMELKKWLSMASTLRSARMRDVCLQDIPVTWTTQDILHNLLARRSPISSSKISQRNKKKLCLIPQKYVK